MADKLPKAYYTVDTLYEWSDEHPDPGDLWAALRMTGRILVKLVWRSR